MNNRGFVSQRYLDQAVAAKDRPANETGWQPGALDWIAAHAGDIAAVIMQTERDDDGVSYEVLVRDRTVMVCEGSEDLRNVWSASVRFGHTDATVAGGSAFRFAAQEQEKAVERIVGVMRGRGCPECGSLTDKHNWPCFSGAGPALDAIRCRCGELRQIGAHGWRFGTCEDGEPHWQCPECAKQGTEPPPR